MSESQKQKEENKKYMLRLQKLRAAEVIAWRVALAVAAFVFWAWVYKKLS